MWTEPPPPPPIVYLLVDAVTSSFSSLTKESLEAQRILWGTWYMLYVILSRHTSLSASTRHIDCFAAHPQTQGSSNSYAIKKKDELERVAKSNR